jgi:hypothetical protein
MAGKAARSVFARFRDNVVDGIGTPAVAVDGLNAQTVAQEIRDRALAAITKT